MFFHLKAFGSQLFTVEDQGDKLLILCAAGDFARCTAAELQEETRPLSILEKAILETIGEKMFRGIILTTGFAGFEALGTTSVTVSCKPGTSELAAKQLSGAVLENGNVVILA